jgi:transcriptional regulator with XRE-family HTH domain
MPDTWLAAVQKASNVRRLRIRRGLTQERLAELAALDDRLVQRVKAAETNMKIAVLVAMALDVDLRRLLRPAEMPKRPGGRPPGFPPGANRKSGQRHAAR